MLELSILDIINNINILINKKIIIKGWVKYKRNSKIGISFILINDGSTINCIQIIANNKLKNYYEEIINLNIGSSIYVCGYIIESKGKNQKYEIEAKHINIIGDIYNPDKYPISNKKHSMEFLRKVSHLRIRTNLFSAISRIRNSIFFEIHNFMNKYNFIWIPTPIITTSDTEGNSELFNISILNNKKDFFGKKVFLTVSGQLNAESYACALSKVYTFGPVFRAENSNTKKHLSEFWMLEPEIAFYKLEDIIKFSESLIKHICNILLNKNENDIIYIYKRNNLDINYLLNLIDNKFININYSEAVNILNKLNLSSIKWGDDISSKDEKHLLNYFKLPLIIKNYPKNIKPFYMKLNDDEITVSSMDILMPNVGEVLGGSEREYDYNILKDKINNNFVNNQKYYKWYLDLRRYGTVPHSGFGLGFERLILSLTGMENIRDISPFPRSSNNALF